MTFSRSLNLSVTDQELNGNFLLFGLHRSTGVGLQAMCIYVQVSF